MEHADVPGLYRPDASDGEEPSSFRWDAHYVTGLTDVDAQHRHLVHVLNQLGALLTRPERPSIAEVEAIFAELAAYAVYHFEEEEALMRQAGLDHRHMAYHRGEHRAFLAEVTSLHAGIAPDDLETAKPLLQFLIYWLAYHILGSDQSMARQMAAIGTGQAPADAFLAEERMKESAVAPLVYALNGLFRQVSERNRALLELNLTLEAKVAERTRALALVNQQLEEVALTDVLTGLPNRRHALRSLAHAWQESEREGNAMACLMVDADGFKLVNDRHGHEAGDDVLRELARRLRHSVRTDDVVCRLGGDEFLVICPRTPLDGALQLGEKLRAAVAELRVPVGDGAWQGSISVGAAARTAEVPSVDALVKVADQAVYAAKRSGKNCVATG